MLRVSTVDGACGGHRHFAPVHEDFMARTHAETVQLVETTNRMGLKAPGILTFLLSFILMLAVPIVERPHAPTSAAAESSSSSSAATMILD